MTDGEIGKHQPMTVFPNLLDQSRSLEFPLEIQLTHTEKMVEQHALTTYHIESLDLKCSPIVFPLLSEEDVNVYVENVANKNTILTEECTPFNAPIVSDDEFECLFTFLRSNIQEEGTYTVECIRVHDGTKAYGGQTVW